MIYVVKCYKCKTKFKGNNLNDLIRDNDLKQNGKLYYCKCNWIDDFAKPKEIEKRFINEFGTKKPKKKEDDSLTENLNFDDI